MSFADYPTARAWYRAHNSSVVAAYLEHHDLAESENAAERFFMNVVLLQQLYEWSAYELSSPGLLDCTRDGALTYAWPYEHRSVWQPRTTFVVQLARTRSLPNAAPAVKVILLLVRNAGTRGQGSVRARTEHQQGRGRKCWSDGWRGRTRTCNFRIQSPRSVVHAVRFCGRLSA